jgi:hypothetical protein
LSLRLRVCLSVCGVLKGNSCPHLTKSGVTFSIMYEQLHQLNIAKTLLRLPAIRINDYKLMTCFCKAYNHIWNFNIPLQWKKWTWEHETPCCVYVFMYVRIYVYMYVRMYICNVCNVGMYVRYVYFGLPEQLLQNRTCGRHICLNVCMLPCAGRGLLMDLCSAKRILPSFLILIIAALAISNWEHIRGSI